MLICMEALQRISREISFSSPFQLGAICSLGICSQDNQLCDGCVSIFQWEVRHCLTCGGRRGTQDLLSFWKNNYPSLDGRMPLASLTSSSRHFRAAASVLRPLLPCSFLTKVFVHLVFPFFYILCCLVAENVSPTYL